MALAGDLVSGGVGAVSPPLSWQVDSRDGLAVVTVSGGLDAGGGAALYRALTRCLADEPVAILVELSGMTVTEREAAKILPAIVRQAGVWPGTPLLLCAPNPATASLIAEWTDEPVTLFTTTADARATLTGRDELISEPILPVPGAARHARNVATEACVRWNLPHLTAPVTLVASELVTNAIEHAGTAMTLQLRLRPRYLYLAVHDGAAHTAPSPRHGTDAGASGGRGLHLVAHAATRWGYLPRPDGKVVWAAFATSPNA
jgi:anti-sigma regulatory factor (Ser/Thr protein kinase)